MSLLCVGIPAAALGPSPTQPTEPPSSLELARGTVHLLHSHNRVRACEKSKRDGVVSCRPESESADARTSLRLVPVRTGRIDGKDNREVVEVSLDETGAPARPLQLGVGGWDLEWVDAQRRARFTLGEGDELSFQLQTVSGACKLVKRECTLTPATLSRKIVQTRP